MKRANWFKRTLWKLQAVIGVLCSSNDAYYIDRQRGSNVNKNNKPYPIYVDVAFRGYCVEVKVNGSIEKVPFFGLDDAFTFQRFCEKHFPIQ